MADRRAKLSAFTKKIDEFVRKTGFNENFITAATHHLNVLYEVLEKDDVDTRQEMCNLLMSKLFIDKLDMYPTQRFNCQVDENSAWPVPVLPSEVFGDAKPPDAYRIKCFYECLKVADILDCRVSSVLPSEYHLRVIHKYGVTRMLDDLNLIVVMPRIKTELSLLKKELLTSELIRVAVSEINKGDDSDEEIIVRVTVDEKSVEFTRMIPKLGMISEKELPPYVLEPPDSEKYSSYSEYFNSMPQFRNPTLLHSVFGGFGVDPIAVHSYYPKFDGMKCSDEFTGQTLLKESKLSDAKNYTNSAIKEFEKKDFAKALKSIEMALQSCPAKDPLMCKLYEIRADIHAEMEIPHKLSMNYGVDLELAYYIDPSNKEVRKKISKLIFCGANRLYHLKRYKEAVVALETAVEHDKENDVAVVLMEHIKKKHHDLFLNLDEETLYTLEEKKKELVTKLKKIES